MTYLFLSYLALFGFLSFKAPKTSLLFIIITLPSYLIRFELFNIPFTLLEGMILVAFLAWLIKNLKPIFQSLKSGTKKRKPYPFSWEIILLLIVSFLAAGMSGFSESALGIWKAYFFEPILLFILIINYFRTKKDLNKIINALGVSALLVSLIAIFQQITGAWIFNDFWADAENRRVVSLFGYPNAVGLYLAPIILLMLGLLVKAKKSFFHYKNIFLFLTIIASSASIYFAKSDGALIGVSVAIVIFLFLYNKKSRLIALGLCVVAGTLIFSSPEFNQQLEKKLTLADKSGQIRISQWQESLTMLLDGRIITGAGLANYQNVMKEYHQEGIFIKNDDPDWHRKTVFNSEYREAMWQPLEIYLYPHNIFLNFWTELTLFGAILFIALFIRIFYLTIKLAFQDKEYKYLNLAILGAFLTMVIHGVVDVPYFKNDLSAMFWIILAILAVVKIKLQEKYASE